MNDEKKPVYHFWNGKNINGEVKYYDMINEGSRNEQTELKYDVSNDTIAGDDL